MKYLLTTLIAVLLSAIPSSAQQPGTEPNCQQAVGTSQGNALSQYCEAAALEKAGDLKAAAKAYEKVFKSESDAFEKKLARMIDIRVTGKELFTEFLRDEEQNIRLAISSAEKAVALKAKMREEREWMTKASLLVQLEGLIGRTEPIYTLDQADTKLQILSKPRPSYTNDARFSGTSGIVILLVVFGSDGTLQFIAPRISLPNGLTAEAIAAAKKIKFKPAIKDARPISVFAQIEYSFSFG